MNTKGTETGRTLSTQPNESNIPQSGVTMKILKGREGTSKGSFNIMMAGMDTGKSVFTQTHLNKLSLDKKN